MRKPNNYDSVAASLTFEPLALGGHPCVIKGVEETKSAKSGKDMLKIALDIGGDDPQAGYYAEKFKNDDRENKKWPCISYIVTEDKDGNASRNLAQFVTSVEESNPGFQFPWDRPELLKGKQVGGVFGQEEYKNDKGEIKKATKLFWFRDVAKVKDAPVPKLKEYKPQITSGARVNSFADISADDIPF